MIIDSHIHLGRFTTYYFYGMRSTLSMLNKIYKDYDGIVIMPTEEQDNLTVVNAVKACKMPAKFVAWVEPKTIKTVMGLNFDGLKLHPAYTKVPITHESYDDIIALAENRDVPVTVHSGEIEQTSYQHILRRAKEFKNVKFIIGHMGGKMYQNTWNCPMDAKDYDNVYLDTTMKIKGWMIQHGQDIVGSKRMLFGSDFPLMNPEVGARAILEEPGLDHDQILHHTAKKLFW